MTFCDSFLAYFQKVTTWLQFGYNLYLLKMHKFRKFRSFDINRKIGYNTLDLDKRAVTITLCYSGLKQINKKKTGTALL